MNFTEAIRRKIERPTVKCRICGNKTTSVATGVCNDCVVFACRLNHFLSERRDAGLVERSPL